MSTMPGFEIERTIEDRMEIISSLVRGRKTLDLGVVDSRRDRQIWKIWRYGGPRVHEEHVCWFDPITLGTLCRQCQLDPYAGYWIQPHGGNVLKTWPRWFRKCFSESFMILARPAHS
jgi:hypothetical protein